MPYSVRHVKGGYRVVNTKTGRVHSRHTSKAKAEAQVRLLRGVEHGFTPTGKKRRKRDSMGRFA